MLSRDRMREYQRERRARLGGLAKTERIRVFVDPVEPKFTLEELKQIRGRSIPIDDGVKIYFLFRGDEIVYIGQSASLLQRISTHSFCKDNKKDFDSVAVISSDKEHVKAEERAYINYHKPEYNKTNKQPHTKLVCPECERLRKEIAELTRQLNEERAKKKGVVAASSSSGGHHPNCSCFICRPPK